MSVNTYQLAALVLLSASGFCVAEDQSNWPRWRGPLDNGSTMIGTYPIKWDADNVLWSAPLPGKGCSTPIVWDRRIYVTAPAHGHDAVLAFDWSGEQLWRTTFGPEDPGKNRNGSGSNASPATDGQGVFVYFKSGTLAALELDGTVRWQTNLCERFGTDTLFGTMALRPCSPTSMSSWPACTTASRGLPRLIRPPAKCVGRSRATMIRPPKSITDTPRPSSFNTQASKRCWFGEHNT